MASQQQGQQQQQQQQQAPPPYDERINAIRRALAEATRVVTSGPDPNGAVGAYVAAVEGVVMRLQREIDMARLARDQYHQARDDLWRDNEMLRTEINKMKSRTQVNANASSAATPVDLSRARSLPSDRAASMSDRDRATQRAREVASTMRLTRKVGGSGEISRNNNVGAMGAADDTRIQRNGSTVLVPPESPANGRPNGTASTASSAAVNINSNGNDRTSASAAGAAASAAMTASGTQSDQYQPIDNVLAVADIAARAPSDFGGPASPAKLPPLPPAVPSRNMNGNNNNLNNNNNNNNNNDAPIVFNALQIPDLLRDPNYAPLPVQSRNVPNAVANNAGMAQSGENYGEVPHMGDYK